MLALAVIAALSLGQTPQHRLFFQPNLPRTSGPLFSFAPLSGAGMGTACACTTPTGSKGEALTFTRASTGFCTKGSETTGIANGDLVECASGQPRVMPGGDGTGALGLNVWEARTNSVLQSQAIDNASWTKVGAGVAAPVITADFAVAPDGTTTAERVQFAATSGTTQDSVVYAGAGCPVSADSGGFYVKGNGTSGTILYFINLGSGYSCQTCSFNASTWTRCVAENFTVASVGNFVIGNEQGVVACGQGARPALDVLIWQADCQAGVTLSPPIKTTTAAATRVAEVASLSVALTGTRRSFGATYVAPSTFGASRSALQIYFDASNDEKLYATSTAAASTVTSDFRIATISSTQATAATMTASASNALAAYYDGTNKAACLGGTCVTGAASLTLATGTSTVYLGGRQAGAGFEANGTIKGVCVDPSPGKCR